jgi:superfamily II DNA or RNA helicase
MNNLRDYQEKISNDAVDILQRKKVVLLAMEVRTGKTLTALETAKKYGSKNILFITKIKAFSSIQKDYDNFGYKFKITIINKESLHKIENNLFDLIIVDEVHGYSAFPKPSLGLKQVRDKFGNLPMILLSGTPTPESFSQFFHIFRLSKFSPFEEFKNFYEWANKYVNIVEKNLGYAKVKDYSDANKKDFWHLIRHNILTFTQEQAGFITSVNEMVLEVEMKPITYEIIKRLKKDLYVKNQEGKEIIGDTAVKLLQKMHQVYSGTCKFEDGTAKSIDYSKIEYIYNNFKEKKIAIFYKFQEELKLMQEFLKDKLTTDLEEFNSTDKWIALQFVSGREGISLAKADYLLAYNIDYSATTYFQFRDRLTTMQRKENTLFWIFSKSGIELDIYKKVKDKKNYTTNLFIKENDIKISEQNNKRNGSKRLSSFKNY